MLLNRKDVFEDYTQEIFEQYFDSYIVLEGDENIINKYKIEHPKSNIQIKKTYFEEWDEKEYKEFDIIIAGFILEHVENPREILKKYKQKLSKNGKIFITVPNAEALNRRIGFEAGILANLQELSENDKRQGHRRYYTVNEIKEECQSVGLKIQRVEGIYMKPLTTKQLLSLDMDRNILEAFCTVGKDYPELCVGILLECS